MNKHIVQPQKSGCMGTIQDSYDLCGKALKIARKPDSQSKQTRLSLIEIDSGLLMHTEGTVSRSNTKMDPMGRS